MSAARCAVTVCSNNFKEAKERIYFFFHTFSKDEKLRNL